MLLTLKQIPIDEEKLYGSHQILKKIYELKDFESKEVIGTNLLIALPSLNYDEVYVKLPDVFIENHEILKHAKPKTEDNISFKINLIEPHAELWKSKTNAGLNIIAKDLVLIEK